MVTATSKVFHSHHGYTLKRRNVIKDVVQKVMSLQSSKNFDEFIVKKIVRVLTFAR